MISTLVAVSSIINDYVREGRLDEASQPVLVQRADASQDTLVQLKGLNIEFGR